MILYTNHGVITCTHQLPSQMIWIQYWCFIHIHYLHHPRPTDHYPNESSQIFVIYLSNNSPYCTCQEKLRIILFIHTFTNTYIILFYATFYMTSTYKLYKPWLPSYKNIRALYYLLYTVHPPNIQHTHVILIIHYMRSIILHFSTHHPIKTHFNSK